jgi:hypothetical protein
MATPRWHHLGCECVFGLGSHIRSFFLICPHPFRNSYPLLFQRLVWHVLKAEQRQALGQFSCSDVGPTM